MRKVKDISEMFGHLRRLPHGKGKVLFQFFSELGPVGPDAIRSADQICQYVAWKAAALQQWVSFQALKCEIEYERQSDLLTKGYAQLVVA
jgi:hypothetical protein